MVLFDNTTLSLALHPGAKPPLDPATKKPLDRVSDRIEKLIEDLEAESERVIIPTPVLSEFLVLAGEAGSQYLDEITANPMFSIKSFDTQAAIELAAMEIEIRKHGNKRAGVDAPWTKVKFDRQIVAIAKTNQVTRIYSDDSDVMKFATKAGIEVIPTWELPLPKEKQIVMELHEETTIPVIPPPPEVSGSHSGSTASKAGAKTAEAGGSAEPNAEIQGKT